LDGSHAGEEGRREGEDLAVMTIFKRVWMSFLAAAIAGGAAAAGAAAQAGAAAPGATAEALYATLLKVMKGGPALGFSGRLKLIDPEVRRDYDLPLMTRLVVGPSWRGYAAADQNRLVEAFSDYSIAVYASRFKDFSGERFVVDPGATAQANGSVIVHTTLVPRDGEPVHLDYLMRNEPSGWRIIDVFLSGTISELATRRSEYSSVLRDGGAEALVRLLRKKTADLGG
jgi:phospholipid transport system substrate-binding protein